MDRSKKMKMLGFSILVAALSVTASIETCYAANKANMLNKGDLEKNFRLLAKTNQISQI